MFASIPGPLHLILEIIRLFGGVVDGPLTQSGRFLDLGVLHAFAIGDIVKQQQYDRLEGADY